MPKLTDNIEVKLPQDIIDIIPQERVSGDILRGRGPRRGNLEQLLKYWRPIMRKPGGFRRCLVILADHPKLYPLERICAWLHHETTGLWPNEGNHHRGGKLGSVVTRTVKKGKRKRRRKDAEAGLDFPLRRIEMRIAQDNKSQMYAMLDGTQEQLDWKAGNRVAHTIESILLPGERGVFSPRRIARISLTPGGSGGPGPGFRGPSRSRLGIRGGSATDRGFRCPSGFQNGGKFTDRAFTTCGAQLFAIPGSLPKIRNVVGVGGNRRTPGAAVAASTPTQAPVSGGVNSRPLPPPVGRPNPSMLSVNVVDEMKKLSRLPSGELNRKIVRSDGSVIDVITTLEILAKQEDNPDLLNSVYMSSIPSPVQFGAAELELMQTGIRKIAFALPGGGEVSIERASEGPMSPGDARSFGKALSEARKVDLPDTDIAGILRETAARTDSATFKVEIPGVREDLNRPVRVERDGSTRSVPMWVYRTFLSQDAAGRAPDSKPYALVSGAKDADADAVRWKSVTRRDSDSQWGPLRYTAPEIPTLHDSDYHNLLKFKASLFRSVQRDASTAYQETKARAVWDLGIDRFRCPPGTPDAGQLTNRFGIGCAAGVIRRAVGATVRAVDGLDRPRADVAPSVATSPIPGRRSRKRPRANRVANLLDRMANVLDPDSKPGRKKRTPKEKKPGSLLDRIANVLDPDVGKKPDGGKRGSLLDRIADIVDPDVRSRNSLIRGTLLSRIADIIDPNDSKRVRPFRDRRVKFAERMSKNRDVRASLPILIGSDANELEEQWKRRLNVEKLSIDDAFDFLFNGRQSMDAEEFRKLQTELYDLQDMRAMQRGSDKAMPEAVDQLSDGRWNELLARMSAEERILDAMSKDELEAERKKIADAVEEAMIESIAREKAEKVVSAQLALALGDEAQIGVMRQRHKRRAEIADGELDKLDNLTNGGGNERRKRVLTAERDSNLEVVDALDDTGDAADGQSFKVSKLPTLSTEQWRELDPHELGWGPKPDDPRYGMVIVDDDGKVLLRKPKGEFGGYAWTFPKGSPDANEHPVDAAIREVGEETGLVVEPIDVLPGKFDSADSSSFFFIGRVSSIDDSLSDGETEELRWVTMDEARDLIGETPNVAGQERDHDILDTTELKYGQMQIVSSVDPDYNPAERTVELAATPDVVEPEKRQPREKVVQVDSEIGKLGDELIDGYTNSSEPFDIFEESNADALNLSKEALSSESKDWDMVQDRLHSVFVELRASDSGDEQHRVLKKNGYTSVESFLIDYREASLNRWAYGGEKRNRVKSDMPKNQPMYLRDNLSVDELEAERLLLIERRSKLLDGLDDKMSDGKFVEYSDSRKDVEWLDTLILRHDEAIELRVQKDIADESILEAQAADALKAAKGNEESLTTGAALHLTQAGADVEPLEVHRPDNLETEDGSFSSAEYAKARYATAKTNATNASDQATKSKYNEIKGRVDGLNEKIDAADTQEEKDAIRNSVEARKIYLQAEAYQFSIALRERRERGKVKANELLDSDPSLAKLEAKKQAYEQLVSSANNFEPGLLNLDGEYASDRVQEQYAFDLSRAEAMAGFDVVNVEIDLRKAKIKGATDNYAKSNKTKAVMKDSAHHLLTPNEDGTLGHKWVDTSPVGELDEAVKHIEDGGEIMDVAEGLRRDAILANTGTGKRYKKLASGSSINSMKGGKKHETVVVEDTQDPLGRKYVLKRAMRDDREYIREQSAQTMMQMLGMPSSAIVLDGVEYEFNNPDHKGLTTNRSMILEHLDNIVDMELASGGEPVDMQSLGSLLLLDAMTGEFDRHSENRIAYRLPDGSQMILPIDQGKAFAEWDEDYTGKPAPILYNTMGVMALSKVKTTDEKKALVRSIRKGLRDFDIDEFETRMRASSDAQAFGDDEVEFVDGVVDFVRGQIPLIEAQLDKFVDDLPGGDITSTVALSPNEIAASQPSAAGKAVTAIKSKIQIPLRYFGYDGGEIKDSRVRVRRVDIQRMNATGGLDRIDEDATEVTFKLRDAALFGLVDGAADDGWTVESGMNLPSPSKVVTDVESGFSVQNDIVGTKVYGHSGVTLRKELDDGTVVYVYSNYTSGAASKSQHVKGSFSGMVRIINPDSTSESMTDENVKSWMSAVGVKTHGPPTPEQMEELAAGKLAVSLLGPHGFSAAGSTEAALESVEETYGITVDDLEVSVDSLGQIQVLLPEEALDTIPQLKNVGYLTHRLWNDSHSDSTNAESAVSWLTNGMLPTTDRWMTEVDFNGGSSHADATEHGSADFMYNHLWKGDTPNGNYEKMISDGTPVDVNTSSPIVMVYSKKKTLTLGYRITRSDMYGDSSSGTQSSYGLEAIDNGNNKYVEFMPKGTVAPTRYDRLIVKSAGLKASIISGMVEAGVLDVDGVPLDKFIIVR